MLDAAEAHRFEDAARARNRLQAVRMLQEQNLVHRAEGDDADVVGVAREGDLACVLIFPLRGGRLGDRLVYTFENAAGATLDELVAAASAERYDAAGIVVPPLVLVPPGMEGVAAPLAELLRRRRGAAVEVRTAQRGEKRRLAESRRANASCSSATSCSRASAAACAASARSRNLRDVLGLEVAPARIECFDISNTGERATVASMVVFEHGTPRKAHYRSFAITHGRLDDFASMAEAVGRRFARLASGDEDDPSFAALPDLVVIDGGKGQLGAAQRAIADLELPHVPMIGLAKRIEEIFLPDRPDPILLDVDAPGLLLLQRVRDEAHRFALGRHRIRRGREATASVIDQIPGSGRRAAARSSRTSATRARLRRPPSQSSQACPACRARRRARSTSGCTRRAAPPQVPRVMSIRAVSYSVPTWGVGVLLFADGVLIDHEPPRSRGPVVLPTNRRPARTACSPTGSCATSAASPSTSPTSISCRPGGARADAVHSARARGDPRDPARRHRLSC